MVPALEQGQFHIYLQTKVHMPASRIVGGECLVCWRHPEKGIIPPDQFIPFFGKNGFILFLDAYVWERACALLRRGLDEEKTSPPLSVDVAHGHVEGPTSFETLLQLIEKYNLPPRLLELEITESTFFEADEKVFTMISRLRERGFRFAMDDFGSGCSSLNMLRNIPMDIDKTDEEFFNAVMTAKRGKSVIRHSIAVLRELDAQVVAGGVETLEQARFLAASGCLYAQGFFHARPVPMETFEAMAFGATQVFPLYPEPARFA